MKKYKIKKCGCGVEFSAHDIIKNCIGINEVGVWYNCDCCSTNIILREHIREFEGLLSLVAESVPRSSCLTFDALGLDA